MELLCCNALVQVTYSGVSGQCSHTIDDYFGDRYVIVHAVNRASCIVIITIIVSNSQKCVSLPTKIFTITVDQTIPISACVNRRHALYKY